MLSAFRLAAPAGADAAHGDGDGGKVGAATVVMGPRADHPPWAGSPGPLRHPNVLAVLGRWEIDGCLVVATEPAEASLWDRFLDATEATGRGLERDELNEHMAEAAKALDALHLQQGRPLGDLRPQSLRLIGGGIKLALPPAWALPDLAVDGADVSAEGAPAPSPYAAPEALAGAPTPRSDQFSLAAVYCHLRGGRAPLPASEAWLVAGAGAGAPAPAARAPDLSAVPGPERPALARALAVDPGRRWPSCRAFVEALRADIRAAESEAGAFAAPAPPLPYDPPPTHGPAVVGRTTALALAAATGLTAVAATLGLLRLFDRLGPALPTVPGGPRQALLAQDEAPPRYRLQSQNAADPSEPEPETEPDRVNAPKPLPPAVRRIESLEAATPDGGDEDDAGTGPTPLDAPKGAAPRGAPGQPASSSVTAISSGRLESRPRDPEAADDLPEVSGTKPQPPGSPRSTVPTQRAQPDRSPPDPKPDGNAAGAAGLKVAERTPAPSPAADEAAVAEPEPGVNRLDPRWGALSLTAPRPEEISPGGAARLALRVDRERPGEPVELTFPGAPAGVELPGAVIVPPGKPSADVEVTVKLLADATAEPDIRGAVAGAGRTVRVPVVARAGGSVASGELTLVVRRPPVHEPAPQVRPPDVVAPSSEPKPEPVTATAPSEPPEAPPPPPSQPSAVVRLEAPAGLSVPAGGSTALSVRVVWDGLGVPGPVELRLGGLPRGVSSPPRTVAPLAPGGARFDLPVSAEPDAAEGQADLRLVARPVGPAPGPGAAEGAGAAAAASKGSVPERVVKLTVQPRPGVEARRRGDDLLRREEFDRAVAAYTEALGHAPNDPPALHGRGLALYGKGDYARALTDLDAAARLSPGDAAVLNNRGLARLARGDAASALADFQAALQLDPSFAVVRYNLGRAHAQAGDPARAIVEYDAAVRLNPTFAKAYKARGDARAKLGDRDGALADYNEAVRLNPNDAAALNNRGLLRLAQGEPHRAIADFDEAIRVSPGYAVVRYNRGRVYAHLGDTTEAIAAFDQAIRLDPTFARAFTARAEAFARRGDPARAEADRTEAARLEAGRSAPNPANNPAPAPPVPPPGASSEALHPLLAPAFAAPTGR
jgi:tetratricopeptide (TPR) repeat protein